MYTAFELAKKYVSFYLQAVNSKGHGVHSPFVFDFIKFVKNERSDYDIYVPAEKLRDLLLRDKSTINVEDFGAGSTVIKTNKRVIQKMAASSLKPRGFAQLLHRIVRYYKPKTMVELGTSFGITSAYLASGNKVGKLYSLEGSPAIADIARKTFRELAVDNIELVEGDFGKTLDPLLENIAAVDLVFIDGNHKKLPTLEYFEKFLKKSCNESILIFDDIHWSAEMEEAWEIIKSHPSVTLSIDMFFIGIVFLRKDFKVKQHFKIRL